MVNPPRNLATGKIFVWPVPSRLPLPFIAKAALKAPFNVTCSHHQPGICCDPVFSVSPASDSEVDGLTYTARSG